MTEDKRHAEYDCKWRQQRRTSDPPKPKTRLCRPVRAQLQRRECDGRRVEDQGRQGVCGRPALAAWIAATAAELAGVDALVCNVSALAVGDTAESWKRSFVIDMMPTVNPMQAAVPYLEKSSAARSS